MKSINPFNGELIKQYSTMSDQEISLVIADAWNAFLKFKEMPFVQKSGMIMSIAQALSVNKEEYAKLISLEMGKVYSESLLEIEKCILVCEYYAKNAQRFLADEVVDGFDGKATVSYRPIGPVLAIMPWNFPFWQVFRFAIPALMAGNVVLLKHASNVSGCAIAIEKIFTKAACPKNIFNTLLIKSSQVDLIIENKSVRAITLTGSAEAGRKVAAKAGECLKKCILELGGSDAYIVLDDADIKKTVIACVKGRLINAGQSCIAAKRFIVVESVYDEFLAQFISAMKEIKMGDPFGEGVHIGPMANVDLRDSLHKQVQDSIAKGAICVLGGNIPDEKGSFYPPTILTKISKKMPAYSEELFGPVASVIKVRNAKEAIEIANDSDFGLGAAVFTKDFKRGGYIAKDLIEAGLCFVNDFVKSDPALPFGGIKESGYGRELSSFGIREFVNIKTVLIRE